MRLTHIFFHRHLDDVHQNLEDDRQDEVKDWFKVQMEKAKRFQPLAVLNQKLKGLDVFESNENSLQPYTAPNYSRPYASGSGSGTQAPVPPDHSTPRPLDPEDVITKEHWQPRTFNDTCLEPMCGKRLNATNGCVNCRKCGKLFCEEHTMYQMKLSRSAQHEPVRGFWCRVCETCYKSREGYNDHNGRDPFFEGKWGKANWCLGLVRDQTDLFKAMRKPVIDKEVLEMSRLEKRLTRLTQLLASLPLEQIQSGASKLWSITWQNDQRKTLEQTIVSWQDDASVSRCPFCQQDFSSYTFRRHHCRTCGRVVCGDPVTGCSVDVPLSVAPCKYFFIAISNRLVLTNIVSRTAAEKPGSMGLVNVDVRLCRDCRATLFNRRDFEADSARKPPDVRAYENLIQFERGIRLLLPKFQKLLAALQ